MRTLSWKGKTDGRRAGSQPLLNGPTVGKGSGSATMCLVLIVSAALPSSGPVATVTKTALGGVGVCLVTNLSHPTGLLLISYPLTVLFGKYCQAAELLNWT